MIGLFGTLARAVVERRQELAIRAAVGASPGRLVRLVLRSAVAVTGLGLALGMPAAVATGRGLASLLYGVSPYDPATLAAVAAVVVLTALAASTIPARRTARLDPMVVLRTDYHWLTTPLTPGRILGASRPRSRRMMCCTKRCCRRWPCPPDVVGYAVG